MNPKKLPVVVTLLVMLTAQAIAADPTSTSVESTPTPSATPSLTPAPRSMRPWPKNQVTLQVQEGLLKIARIPYYLVKDVVEIVQKGHAGYTRDFFKKYGLVRSFDAVEKSKDTKSESSDSENKEFEIFAYNRNFETQAEIFDFNQYLTGVTAYDKKSCAEVCPNGFEMLSINRHQLLPTPQNFLGFRNKGDDFVESILNTSGYCWGHSTTMDNFHYLAFFDKDNVMNQQVPEVMQSKDGNMDQSARLTFYKHLIDEVVIRDNATIIPGFANVREFVDSDPEIKAYMKIRVAHKWAKNAVKIRSIGNMFFDGKPMSQKRTKNLLREVETRLLSNQTPRIIFAAEGDSTYSHVLNVYGLSKNKAGTYRMYVFETNYYTELSPNQSHFIEIDREGHATYEPLAHSRIGHNRLGKIKFTFEEKQSEVDYVHTLTKFCRAITHCQK